MRGFKGFWRDLPITRKLLLEIMLTAIALFASNLLIYSQINRMVRRMDSVYMSNENLTQLTDALAEVQNYTYRYLEVKDSQSLSDYYRSEQRYRELLEYLNRTITDHPIQILEKNICQMSEKYLQLTSAAVQAKRGMNIERYKSSYEASQRLFQFINDDISTLNSQQFKNNTASYLTLQAALRYLQVVCLIMLVIVMLISLSIVMMMTRYMVTPLKNLAETAVLVGAGNFQVKVAAVDSNDELGIVTTTFNQMIESLADYIARMKASADKEQAMLEREYLMEASLKEAQLKYLQFQINPHFLFNSLNAGVQLAVLEDAEKTSVFIEKMADFFRYNVKKGTADATIEEELATVENYIYILNVRYLGEIHYRSEIDPSVLMFSIPSMILQPLVENAVHHGISDIDWEKEICLQIRALPDQIEIRVWDNGRGLSSEQVKILNSREQIEASEDSRGIGLGNVIGRLELYYNLPEIVRIGSDGPGLGTTVTMRIPKQGGNNDV